MNDVKQERWARLLVGFAFFVIAVALLIPLAMVEMPPLLDYPIHVARGHILLHHGTDIDLSAIYQVDWRPIPNLAIDIWLLLFGQVMDVEIAGRLFLGTCLVLTVAGVAVLHRVIFHQWRFWPLMAALPAYHGALMAGFMNFSFGAALISFGLAAWIGLQNRSLSLRLGVHSFVVLVLYFCHMLSLGLFGIAVGLYALWEWNDQRRAGIRHRRWITEACLLGAPFLVATGFYLRYAFTNIIGNEDKLLYGAWALGPKLRGLMMPVLTHHIGLDCLSLVFLVGVPVVLVIYQRLSFVTGLLLGPIVIAALFLILPGDLLAAGFVIERFLIVAVLIGLAATQPVELPAVVDRLIATFFVALIIGRSAVLVGNWVESDEYYQRAQTMADAVDRGASVLVVSPFSDPEVKSMRLWQHRFRGYADWHYALINIPNLHGLPIMPLTRQATFTQLHFMQADKQVLSLSPAYRGMAEGDGGSATVSPRVILAGADRSPAMPTLAAFDYVLILYLDHVPPALQDDLLTCRSVYADNDMMLLDIAALKQAPSNLPDLTQESTKICRVRAAIARSDG